MGCNVIDVATNYSDGLAEEVVGNVLTELIADKQVGNVLGQQMQFVEGVPGAVSVGANLMHCISPEWIEQDASESLVCSAPMMWTVVSVHELSRSLERLQLKCLDCVLLHCPEVESKVVGMEEVYKRLSSAFLHLESEVRSWREQRLKYQSCTVEGDALSALAPTLV
eukprot:6457637-Amphidinium_carterae.1